ncbi:MAG TPA: hypothetical protein VM287_16585 [Egibacteraceae bacterium]|nr:hypothetical protein [Egibacteraceae bacterium]
MRIAPAAFVLVVATDIADALLQSDGAVVDLLDGQVGAQHGRVLDGQQV